MNYPEANLWVSKAVSRQDPLYEASFGEWTRGAFYRKSKGVSADKHNPVKAGGRNITLSSLCCRSSHQSHCQRYNVLSVILF